LAFASCPLGFASRWYLHFVVQLVLSRMLLTSTSGTQMFRTATLDELDPRRCGSSAAARGQGKGTAASRRPHADAPLRTARLPAAVRHRQHFACNTAARGRCAVEASRRTLPTASFCFSPRFKSIYQAVEDGGEDALEALWHETPHFTASAPHVAQGAGASRLLQHGPRAGTSRPLWKPAEGADQKSAGGWRTAAARPHRR
jgi:hypothetical protein